MRITNAAHHVMKEPTISFRIVGDGEPRERPVSPFSRS